jgi:hypothetical protein
MALLSGTAAKVALDLLRSGRAFEADGVKMFERALKATQRGQVPEGAVSEFRKLIDGLEAEAIHRRLTYWKQGGILDSPVDASGIPAWSDIRMESRYIPKSVNYWTDFAGGYDQKSVEWFRRQAALADKKAGETSIEGPPSPRTLKVDSPAYIKQRLRRSAVEDRTSAAIVEALIRLFGEKGPV